ncbi:unnamed protein product, partial [Porites lobata]
ILNNLAPDYLVDLIHVYEPARCLVPLVWGLMAGRLEGKTLASQKYIDHRHPSTSPLESFFDSPRPQLHVSSRNRTTYANHKWTFCIHEQVH